jgi:phenylalanyl-tRNA synthetase beta subunit
MLKLIQNQLQKNKLTIYKEYSLYPKIIKDLSFIIKKIFHLKNFKKHYMLMEQNFYLK